MALYICYKNGKEELKYLGNSFRGILPSEVKLIQADGDELDVIHYHLPELIQIDNRVCTFSLRDEIEQILKMNFLIDKSYLQSSLQER